MRSLRVAVVCLVLLAAGACRTDPAVTMLERENRQLEDVIYQQRDIIEDYRRALESCRAPSATPAGRPAAVDGPSLGEPQRRPLLELSDPPPATSAPSRTRESETLGPPVIELPNEATPSGRMPDTLRVPGRSSSPSSEAPPYLPPSGSGAAGSTPAQGAGLRGGSAQVAQIALSKIIAWAYDTDRTSGDEGLSVVVEPRDAAGRLVRAAAAMSVVVLDPALEGQASRVARWDFSPDEIARLFHSSSLGEGIHLEMVWPAAPPVNSRLHLFVRYETDDGRKVEADLPIEVNVAEIQGPNWQPTDPEVPSPENSRTATERRRREPVPAARASDARSPRTASAPRRIPTLAPPRPEAWSPDRP